MTRSVVENWFEAFRQRDLSLLYLSEEFSHSSPFGQIKGKETYLSLVKENEEAFFNPQLEIVDVLEAGDKLAVRYLVNNNPACDCFYLRDGKIVEIHSYYHFGEKPQF